MSGENFRILTGRLAVNDDFNAENRPCIIIRDALQLPSTYLKVKKDACGKVEQVHWTSKVPMIRVLICDRDRVQGELSRGWVRGDNVKIGTLAIHGEITTAVRAKPRNLYEMAPVLQRGPMVRDGKFVSLVTVFLDTLRQETRHRDLLTQNSVQLLQKNSGRDLALRLATCIRRLSDRYLAVLNSDHCTMQEEIQAARELQKNDRLGSEDLPGKSMIYFLRYSGAPREDIEAIYTGYTSNLKKRILDHQRLHQSARRDPNAKVLTHYRSAQKYERQQMFGAALMEDEDDEYSAIFEQVFLSAHETYSTFIKRFAEREDTQDFAAVPSDTTAEVDNGMPSLHCIHGAFMIKAIKCAFRASGWNLQSVPLGLNVESPMCTGHNPREKVVWTRSKLTTLEEYRRDPVRLFIVNNLPVIELVQRGKRDITVGGSILKDLPKNRDIYPVVEIMNDNMARHAVPFFRLPTTGCYKNWHLVNKIAIAVEWKNDDGVWYRKYLEDQSGWHYPLDENDRLTPGTLSGYVRGIAVYRFFKQIPIVNLPDTAFDLDVAEVLDLSLDHLEQKFILTPSIPQAGRTLPDGQEIPKSEAEKVAGYLEAGFKQEDIGRPIGSRNQANIGARGSHRVTCDHCFLRSETLYVNRRGVDGDRKVRFSTCLPSSAQSPRCLSTYLLGMPMIFSRTSDIRAGTPAAEKRRDAIALLKLQNRPAEVIDDPLITEA